MKWKNAIDRVLVEVEVRPTSTPAGIQLPNNIKLSTGKGTVLAVGPDVRGAKPGDTVFYEVKFAREVTPGIVSFDAPSILALQREEDTEE